MSARPPLVGLLVIASSLMARRASAYRPFDETDADVAAPRTLELELGPLAVQRTSRTTRLAPGFVTNLGISDRWELVLDHDEIVTLGAATSTPRWQAISDLLVKGLLRRGSLQDSSGVSLALEAGVLLPVIPYRDGVGASGALIASERWPALAVHVNVQAALARDHRFEGQGGVIVEGPSSWRVRPVGETLFARDGQGARTVSALGGAIWEIRERLAVDAAVRAAREDTIGVFELRGGLTWAFAL